MARIGKPPGPGPGRMPNRVSTPGARRPAMPGRVSIKPPGAPTRGVPFARHVGGDALDGKLRK